ncbi:hypothetical protein UAO_02601 [Enterococcus villorum ATCC 700913]|uniref:Uncharacterized protein n=1 Tax=Enterococcus villorum ATCC 700913 TaxID=1158604 RepID=A0ABN0KDU5_9ENTE|nr:hypothetical protein UAO_02601 [Enterococcus villorum ATCC 700913]EOW78710.1 hypothetical protein I591_00253 [Enterococcus villorum ATCC 700913]
MQTVMEFISNLTQEDDQLAKEIVAFANASNK